MTFPGISHVAVTVSDLEASTRWYAKLFDADPVLVEDEQSGTFRHVVFALAGGMLFGLHSHYTDREQGPFHETNVGLDHVAFACRPDELDQWITRLDELGIAHGGRKDAAYGSGVSFRDPDDIALEFFAAA